MADCAMEMCPNWTGDGRVCTCALLDLEPPAVPNPFADDDEDHWVVDEDRQSPTDPKVGV